MTTANEAAEESMPASSHGWERHWRSREIDVPLSMDAARRMWGHSWRVDTHDCERLGTRRATVLLCREPPGSPTCTPIGWVSMRWQLPDDVHVVVDHLAWDDQGGATEAEAWRAVAEMVGAPLPARRARRSVLAA